MMIHTATLLGMLLAASVPSAADPTGASSEATPSATTPPTSVEAPFEGGFKVAVDPVTGQIITEPTEADLEILADGVRIERRRSSWQLRGFRLDHGGEGVFLDGWADHALEVRVDADGTLRMTCAADDDHGDGSDPAATPASPGENVR